MKIRRSLHQERFSRRAKIEKKDDSRTASYMHHTLIFSSSNSGRPVSDLSVCVDSKRGLDPRREKISYLVSIKSQGSRGERYLCFLINHSLSRVRKELSGCLQPAAHLYCHQTKNPKRRSRCTREAMCWNSKYWLCISSDEEGNCLPVSSLREDESGLLWFLTLFSIWISQ